jgi:hypothetical protein
MNKNAIYFIEANVRHTAITVPALIMNNCGLNKVMFKEDCHIDEENGMVLTTDRHWDTKDIIFI